MELLLWRHAEAHEASLGQNDLQRHLTSRGEEQAQRLARWLQRHQPENLHILVSPALRCQQTAAALELPFDTEPGIAPNAQALDLLTVLQKQSKHAAILLVGHQPSLGRLAARLMTGQEADWHFKKGALWWFKRCQRDKTVQTILRTVICPSLLAE